jgi:hypothetical protein
MKTKEEIEQLAFKIYGEGFLKCSFMHGYTQCQEDTAVKFTQLKEAIKKHTWYDEDGFPQVNLYAIENLLVD